MNIRLQCILIVCTLLFAILVIRHLVKKKLHLKYCLMWICAIVLALLACIFPQAIDWCAGLFGIKTPSNFIFLLCGLVMLLLVVALTEIVSHMNARIFRLVQNQAILEERIRKLEQEQKKEDSNEDRNSDISGNE